MLTTLVTLLVLVVETAFATFVASHAWQFRPSRIFVYLTGALTILIAATLLRDAASSPELAYGALAAVPLGIGLYIAFLTLLISALFMPEWWQGRWPVIGWVAVPYALCVGFLFVDLVFQLGIIVRGARFEGIYRLNYQQPVAGVLIGLSTVGQLVGLAVLGVAFFQPRHRAVRPVIAALALAMIVSLALGGSSGAATLLSRMTSLLQTLPVIAVLGYAILGTRLFTPTRAALDKALDALGEAVVVADSDGLVAYANPSAVSLGVAPGAALEQTMGAYADLTRLVAGAGGMLTLTAGARFLEVRVAPVRDRRGARRGTLILARDTTELARRTEALDQERARLASTVAQLEDAQRRREELATTVRAIAFPVIPVLPGVLVLPLIGDFTGARVADFTEVLLRGIEQRRAGTVMLDITGVTFLDEEGASGLLGGVRAAALLGARCVLVGVRPEIAQTIVALGVTLDEVVTAATLEEAVTERLGPLARR